MTFYFNPIQIKARKLQRFNLPARSDARHATGWKNCLSCKHLISCTYPDKSNDYLCSHYESNKYLETPEDYLQMLDPDVVKKELEYEQTAMSNIELMIEQAISDQEKGIQHDFILEDADIPQAKNLVDFYFNPEFETNVKPFPKQIEILSDLFSEVCYNPKCTDVPYSQNIPLDASIDQIKDKITFLEYGVCPTCHQNKMDMWTKYNKRKASTMAICVGQRSGKDWTMGFGFAYQDHILLKMRKPGSVYGLGSSAMLYKTFTAVDFSQALKATFNPYLEFIENSKWFKTYHGMLDSVAKKVGKKLYHVGKEAITWNYHGLASLVQSPDVRAMRGVARNGYSITEVAYFYTKTKSALRLDVDGIIEALQNSTAGVISGYNRNIEAGNFNVPPPLELLASSPRSIKDHIMRLQKQAITDKSIIAKHYSTFEFNPNIKDGDLDKFKRNPELYRTSILCIPPSAVKAFIPDKRLVLACINKDRPNGIASKTITVKSPVGARLSSASVRLVSKNVDYTSPKVMFLDGGFKNNSFALAVAHIATRMEDEREITKTVYDVLLEVIPTDTRPAYYPHILENIILPICDKFNVKYIAADRYAGTIHHLQEADRELGVEGRQRSVVYADFVRFKQDLFDVSIDLPALEIDKDKVDDMGQNNYPMSFNGKPVAHSLLQATTAEDLMNKKVDKGEGFTDDIFYAMVGAHAICNDEELRENFLGAFNGEAIQDEVIGVSLNYAGNSQSIEVSGGAKPNSDYDMGVKLSYPEY